MLPDINNNSWNDYLLMQLKTKYMKFKVGDKVITKRFEPIPAISFVSKMEDFINVEGVIDMVNEYYPKYTRYRVHDWLWPESALTLVEEKPKFKIGDDVIISNIGKGTIKDINGLPKGYNYLINYWWYCESELTLVEEKQKEKQEEIKDEGKPVYILQKDTPDYKAGEEFEFERDFFRYYTAKTKSHYGTRGQWAKSVVEDNPEWFKKKEVPKTYISEIDKGSDNFRFYTAVAKGMIKNVCTISKQRLYEIVIAESKGNLIIKKTTI